MRLPVTIAIIFAIVAGGVACSKQGQFAGGHRVPVLPEQTYRYDTLPLQVDFDPFGGVALDNERVTLGRVLFYETQLSVNNRVSCGSCHLQQHAFSDRVPMSQGFHNGMTGRNSPSIVNAGLQEAFFWDLRETQLEEMVLKPIAHPVEMGLESQEYMVQKLRALPYYPELFASAFGTPEITVERISVALEQFIRAIVSVNTRFDEGRLNGFVDFTEEEELGRQLFFFKFPCSACHGGSELSGLSNAENVGLETDYSDNGVQGTMPFTGDAMDGWFKVPSLRNVEVTAPYMHDGRFATLEEVIEFYNSGVQPHPQLSPMLREHTDGGFFSLGTDLSSDVRPDPLGRQPLRMHMTTVEKQALVTFLKTLTDDEFLRDPRFSDPFVVVD